MLNKLAFYQHRWLNDKEGNICLNDLRYADHSTIKNALKDWNWKAMVIPEKSGTLGAVYHVQLDCGETRVVKTHLKGEQYRQALKREYAWFKALYGEEIYLELVDYDVQTYLIMEELQLPKKEIQPEDVLEMTRFFEKESVNVPGDLKRSGYTLEDLLACAQKELGVLLQYRQISKELCQRLQTIFTWFSTQVPYLPRCACHGDLGDKNILQSRKGELIAIDWEDGFWGTPGYDYLYWLTFFNHRCLCRKEFFEKAPCSRDVAQGILLMILVIKSALSFYNGSYQTNTMTISQRIEEMVCTLETI